MTRFWKCRHCHGTGKRIWGPYLTECGPCDGTGNAMVDGQARQYERRVAELEEAQVDNWRKHIPTKTKRAS